MNSQPTQNHATRVVGNDYHVYASINLGALITIRKYSAWHNSQPLYDLKFQHGNIDCSHATLTALVRQAQEALCAPESDADCSGSFTDMEPA